MYNMLVRDVILLVMELGTDLAGVITAIAENSVCNELEFEFELGS